MKVSFLILSLLIVSSCSSEFQNSKSTDSLFGVDVGNLQRETLSSASSSSSLGFDTKSMKQNISPVPIMGTNVFVTPLKYWESSLEGDTLIFKSQDKSRLSFKKYESDDGRIISNISDLKTFVREKHPHASYSEVTLNGLEGIRADFVRENTEKEINLYLISELGELIYAQGQLNNRGKSIDEGEEILSSTKAIYKGIAHPDQRERRVTLSKGQLYSLSGDCVADERCYKGVPLYFASEPLGKLRIGRYGGYSTGRIVDLGSEEEVPFDSIQVDDGFLFAKKEQTSLSDIYSMFGKENIVNAKNKMVLKEGHVYLIRTLEWPLEDLVVKLRVDSLGAEETVFTYSKLTYVRPQILQEQVDFMNKQARESTVMKTGQGKVTLYDSYIYETYFYSSFNFEFATSSNIYITKGTWDFIFDSGNMFYPHSNIRGSHGARNELGAVIDIGEKDLSSITLEDFPSPNISILNGDDAQVIEGHSYLVDVYDNRGMRRYGAVKVINLNKERGFVDIEFRRIAILPVERDFQNWIKFDSEREEYEHRFFIEDNDRYSNRFCPFSMGAFCVEWGGGISLYRDLGIDYLTTSLSPFASGFVNLGKISFESIDYEMLSTMRGQYLSKVRFENDDIIAAWLENYHTKIVILLKVLHSDSNGLALMKIKHLYTGVAAYSDTLETIKFHNECKLRKERARRNSTGIM